MQRGSIEVVGRTAIPMPVVRERLDWLDALKGIQVAIPGNVGGLGRPRGNRANARHHEKQLASLVSNRLLLQQGGQFAALGSIQASAQSHDMPVIRNNRFNLGKRSLQARLQALQTKSGKGGGGAQAKDFSHLEGAGKRCA